MERLDWKRKLLFVSVPAVLLVAGGSIAASAATQQAGPTTNPGQPTAAVELAATTEPAEPVAVAEPAETPQTTGTADAGHQDPAGVQTDHQFDEQE